MRLGATG